MAPFLEGIADGLITDAIVFVMGAVGFKILQNRLRARIEREIFIAINGIASFYAEHPEELAKIAAPVLNALMQNMGRLIPTEATVKVPLFGKIPAAWVEPVVRGGMQKLSDLMEGLALDTGKKAVKQATENVLE